MFDSRQSRLFIVLGCMGALALATASTAWAGYDSTSRRIPSPKYKMTGPPGGICYTVDPPICIGSFFDVFTDDWQTRKLGPPPGTDRIDSFFDVFTELSMSSGGGSPQTFQPPAQMMIDTMAPLNPPPGTEIYETEMLQLNLQGGGLPAGMMIRESPTRQSSGGTSITDIGGGLYHIDSFFDVFTELSLDGGQSWTPYDGSMHMEGIPEPGTLGLLTLSALSLLVGRRRRKA